MTEAQVKHMAEQFLRWKLPANFNPDGGISFEPIGSKGTPYEYRREPVGTNLFGYTEAVEMVRHMIAGMPSGVAERNQATRSAIEAAMISGETR